MKLTSIGNLISWAAQLSILVSVGAILPRIVGIQHPRWHLIYCDVLLAICLTLSLIKPLQHPTVPDPLTAEIPDHFQQAVAGVSPAQPRLLTAGKVVFGIIVLGIVSRLGWLLIGLVRLRRFGKSAHVLTQETEATWARRQRHRSARRVALCAGDKKWRSGSRPTEYRSELQLEVIQGNYNGESIFKHLTGIEAVVPLAD